MLRSLSSGVSGLINHQTRMDVIGNNISNVNTTGYKQRRVTFEESFNQLVKGATRTESKSGGTNPMQIGLGVSVGSIDVITGQGSLSDTGRIFDLAIEGNAFFGVSDGHGTYYTRNGAFQLDAEGYIVLPTNGMVLQGKMSDSYGNFPAGTAISDLQLPLNQQSPAKVTTEVSIARNLNSEADAKGSINYTQQLLHPADGERARGTNGDNDPGRDYTTLTSLYNSNGQSLNIKENDVLTISWYNQASIVYGETTPASEVSIRITQDSANDGTDGTAWTLDGFIAAIEYALNNYTDENGVAQTSNHTVTLADDGSVVINYNGTNEIFNFQVKSTNPLSDSYVNNAFNFGSYIGPGNSNYDPVTEPTTGVLLRPAEQFDFISDLRDSNGTPLVPGLENGDQINVSGSVGSTAITQSNALTFMEKYTNAAGNLAGTLLDDLITKIRNDFRLPANYVDKDGVQTGSVSMATGNSEDGIPAGSIVILGAKGTDFAINNLSITATNSNSNTTAPTNFNAAMGVTVKREAEDVGQFDAVISVYDESGAEHVLTITFIHTGIAGEWEWKASFAGQEIISPGSGTGKITFGQDGTVSSFLFDNNGSQLVVDPRNGSNTMRISLNVGGPGDFTGITQFASATTLNAVAQNGYPTGSLSEITIDEFGLIEGAFSNGTRRAIAQIMLVDFANPGGLLDLSDSVYTISANSGDPIWGLPVTQSSSTLRPGALEMSNVDLGLEFTNMITTQRGYQANSRIITVSDSMLEELVNLKR